MIDNGTTYMYMYLHYIVHDMLTVGEQLNIQLAQDQLKVLYHVVGVKGRWQNQPHLVRHQVNGSMKK